ncbi:hypothetical protein FBQ96_13305 [Nitrospirales bacterium NOB]|nr:hypothetical protein [Nitrospirales bacterium NOB]
MKHRWAWPWIGAGLVLWYMVSPIPSRSQTVPPSGLQQTQPGQAQGPLGTAPLPNPLLQSATITSTASGASAPQPVTTPSNKGKSFGTIGKDLPGMSGGPPLTAPMGAQDPASRYMRPPVIPPLFCDPSINIPC